MDLLSNIKGAYEIVKKMEHLELKELLGDIREESIDLQNEIINLKNENADLRQRNSGLIEQIAVQRQLSFENDAYWIMKESTRDGPFCSSCYDNKKILIRLHFNANNPEFSLCPNCRFNLPIDRGRRMQERDDMAIQVDW